MSRPSSSATRRRRTEDAAAIAARVARPIEALTAFIGGWIINSLPNRCQGEDPEGRPLMTLFAFG